MRVEVECYSGRIRDERLVRFRLDGHAYMVEEVLDQWYGPEHVFFKVRADDRNVYILRHERRTTFLPLSPNQRGRTERGVQRSGTGIPLRR